MQYCQLYEHERVLDEFETGWGWITLSSDLFEPGV